jgi:hypothetical protein
MTRYGAAGTDTRRVLVPSCPKGWGGTAPTHALRRGCPPSLALLDVAHGSAVTSLRSVGSWQNVWTESNGLTSRLVVPPRRAPRPKAVVGCGAPGAPGRSTGPARPTSSTPF